MDILLIIPGLMLSMIIMAIYVGKRRKKHRKKQNKEPQNKVRFYVARDKNSDLVWLYLGKPTRNVFYECWMPKYISLYSECYFERVGLNKNNYKYLKWEDEPVEVFLNLED